MKRFLSVLLLTLLAPVALAAGYKVVVHPANPASSLTRDEVSALFLKKTTKWPDGSAIVPVDLPESSAARAEFSTEIHRRPVTAVTNFWRQQIFSGRDTPPAEKSSDAQVIAFVKSNAGAVGYVSDAAAVTGLKVITIR